MGRYALLPVLAAVLVCTPVPAASADDFDLYTSSVLAKVVSSDSAVQVDKLAVTDLLKTKPVLARENGCLIIVRTDEDNWAKLVVTLSFRKHADGEVPVIVLQRFQCMRPGTEKGRLAAGKDVYLFDHFQ